MGFPVICDTKITFGAHYYAYTFLFIMIVKCRDLSIVVCKSYSNNLSVHNLKGRILTIAAVLGCSKFSCYITKESFCLRTFFSVFGDKFIQTFSYI